MSGLTDRRMCIFCNSFTSSWWAAQGENCKCNKCLSKGVTHEGFWPIKVILQNDSDGLPF